MLQMSLNALFKILCINGHKVKSDYRVVPPYAFLILSTLNGDDKVFYDMNSMSIIMSKGKFAEIFENENQIRCAIAIFNESGKKQQA